MVTRREAKAPERASRVRQRQRLIDACISALHIHGPSRTTVEKVVALADMSPGIVRFYFDSKDAMLLASLAYLAAEFEERVMVPVAQLRETPVAALERLVDLYLDPDIASPRKVSVWYSFWGEASSRQEYYDICGRKDEDFAALVRDLIGRVVAITGDAHLDIDGITLGLIGALEVLWQGIAFQSEVDIDREAARKQSMGFCGRCFRSSLWAHVHRRWPRSRAHPTCRGICPPGPIPMRICWRPNANGSFVLPGRWSATRPNCPTGVTISPPTWVVSAYWSFGMRTGSCEPFAMPVVAGRMRS